MTKLKIWYHEKAKLTDGAKWEEEWLADEDYTIKYMLICRKDGAAFTASTITIYIAGDPLTRDRALAAIVGTDKLNALPIDEPVRKGEKVKWALTNAEGVTIDVALHLVCMRVG